MESLGEELHRHLPSGSCFPFDSSGSSEFNNNASCSLVGIPYGTTMTTTTATNELVSVEAPQASPSFLSFGNQDSLHDPPQLYMNSGKGVVEPQKEIKSLFSHGSTWSEDTLEFQRQEKKGMGSRPPSSAQDHVIAERKRRERLNQQFIALSTIIPGLKKFGGPFCLCGMQTDKATLLGDAVNYIRQLEEKVKTLEEKASERTVESTILVNKSHISTADHHTSDAEGSPFSEAFPKITASLNGNSILVRVQCEKRKGLFVKVLSEIERHHLSVINTNVMPFASSSLDITVTAQASRYHLLLNACKLQSYRIMLIASSDTD
ncbi:hypothetical protein B296_00034476 [Ensete ventricosum]|uniref:BHLH domain-containing protein n=1 Tax=Ensete ventricosum TaxID=4639 RepID=A0A426XHH3_ENSVE|nr:hypothetical protein B296_00034476 [Ensete ventricosum]